MDKHRGAALRRFAVLAELTDPELELLLRHTTQVKLARGEYLFREGEEGDALYLLERGVLVAERAIAAGAGTAKDLAILPPATTVGEMALADPAPRSASVRAELPAQALRLGRSDFDALLAESPTIGIKLFRAFFVETIRRLRATNEELVAVYEVGKLVAAAQPPREVADQVLSNLLGRLHARHALVALYSPAANALEVAGVVGRAAAALGTRIPLDQGLAARAFDEKKPLLVERLLGATEPWESESMILAPLVVRSSAVGLLVLGAPDSGRPYTVADLSLASAVANISAGVLREGYAPPAA